MEYRQKSARLPKSAEDKERWRRVIIILEHCPLSVVRTDFGFELLSEKHRAYHARHKQDPAEWRPDVVHQSLLHLLDSPLNRAGLLQIFLRTKKGVIVAVDPRLRVPRHIRLFEKMMVSCLHKMKVRAAHGYLSLLRVVGNPITEHIPANCTFIRVEKDGDAVPDLCAFCAACGVSEKAEETAAPAKKNKTEETDKTEKRGKAEKSDFAQPHREAAASRQFRPFAFVIGGMSRGNVEAPYAPKNSVKNIRLGERGMSAAAACSAIVHAFEESWLREDNEEA